MSFTGLVVKSQFNEADIQAIRALEETVNATENIRLKFNWSLMHHREPEAGSDFCYYDKGCLVAYMPLDGFGEIYEITAAVLPEYRHRGIFKQLYEAARSKARTLKASKLLLVNYRESPSGIAAVKAMQIPYDVSEYHMAAENPKLSPSVFQCLQLKVVEAVDLPKFQEMLNTNFGISDMHFHERLHDSLSRSEEPYYFAVLNDNEGDEKAKVIGHIGAMIGNAHVYIRAVGILPEWRQQGYGRELLAAVVRKLSAEGNLRFELDVATSNAGALTLYESCGFRMANVYDYHIVPLS